MTYVHELAVFVSHTYLIEMPYWDRPRGGKPSMTRLLFGHTGTHWHQTKLRSGCSDPATRRPGDQRRRSRASSEIGFMMSSIAPINRSIARHLLPARWTSTRSCSGSV